MSFPSNPQTQIHTFAFSAESFPFKNLLVRVANPGMAIYMRYFELGLVPLPAANFGGHDSLLIDDIIRRNLMSYVGVWLFRC